MHFKILLISATFLLTIVSRIYGDHKRFLSATQNEDVQNRIVKFTRLLLKMLDSDNCVIKKHDGQYLLECDRINFDDTNYEIMINFKDRSLSPEEPNPFGKVVNLNVQLDDANRYSEVKNEVPKGRRKGVHHPSHAYLYDVGDVVDVDDINIVARDDIQE
ncbi:hypothetical protein ACOME3_003903 [Neoechinorhynchus agilis]